MSSSSSDEYDSSDGNSVSDSDSSDNDEFKRRPHSAASKRPPSFASKRPRIYQPNLESGEDRISALPDPIIVNILSLLPSTKEAIRTGALSKRWRFLWTSVASLSFCHGGERASSITDTLLQCSSPKLKKFRINNVDIHRRRIPACLNKWVRFAVNRNVEELHISLLIYDKSVALAYELPSHLFTNSMFTSLLLIHGPFVLEPNGLISWKLLRNLRIDCTELTNDLISNMLLGSPVLETLEFCECSGFHRICIDSPRMRKFVLDGYDYLEKDDMIVLEITAPYITSLDIKGHLGLKDIVLVDVHSLLRANFEFGFSELLPEEDIWKGILQSIQHVNELSFGKSWSKVLSLKGENLHSAPLKCKCLRMEFTGRNDLLGLINLLQSLPDLECLIINENHNDNRLPDLMVVDNHLSSKESAFVHLKTVEIVYSEDWAFDLMEIIQFLMKNARALEEVIIHAGIEFPKKIIDESGEIVYSAAAAASRRLLQSIKKQLDSCQTNKVVVRFEGFDI